MRSLSTTASGILAVNARKTTGLPELHSRKSPNANLEAVVLNADRLKVSFECASTPSIPKDLETLSRKRKTVKMEKGESAATEAFLATQITDL